MRGAAGMMMHHRTTAQNFTFSPKRPSNTVAAMAPNKPYSLIKPAVVSITGMVCCISDFRLQTAPEISAGFLTFTRALLMIFASYCQCRIAERKNRRLTALFVRSDHSFRVTGPDSIFLLRDVVA